MRLPPRLPNYNEGGVEYEGNRTFIDLINDGTDLPVIDLKVTPTTSTTTPIVRAEGAGSNWGTGASVFYAKTADISQAYYSGHDGTATRFTVSRAGTITTAVGLTMTAGGTIATSSNGSILFLPNGTGITRIGDAGDPGNLGTPTNDDFYCAGRAEIDGLLYTDSEIYASRSVRINAGYFLYRLLTVGGIQTQNNQQTVNCMTILTGSIPNYILMMEYDDRGVDIGYPQQTNPTHAYKSADAYLKSEIAGIRHNATDVEIETYKGSLAVTQEASKAHGYFTISGLPTAEETFTIGADTYTWKASSGGAFEITIGADAAGCVNNMVAQINTDDTQGVLAVDEGSVCGLAADTAGYAGNTITTTEACTNQAVNAATLTGGQDGAGGAFWREYHIPAHKADPGGSGATLTVSNATLFYDMDATTEYIYFGTDIHDDWDADSDMVVEVYVALNSDETANDTINATLRADYYAEHDDMDTPKTQSQDLDHDIVSDASAGDVHKLVFILNWDETDNIIQVGDVLMLRFNCDALGGAGEVADVRFLHANIKYRTKYPAIPFNEAFPTEA